MPPMIRCTVTLWAGALPVGCRALSSDVGLAERAGLEDTNTVVQTGVLLSPRKAPMHSRPLLSALEIRPGRRGSGASVSYGRALGGEGKPPSPVEEKVQDTPV